MAMLPKKRRIIPPEFGWEEQQYYTVELAFDENNVIHKSIFFSGFLHRGEPAQYNSIFNPTYEQLYKISDVHYLKVIDNLHIDLNNSVSD